MISLSGRMISRFAHWYWRNVKRFPRDVLLFTLGGTYVAVLLVSPRLLALAAQRFL